MLIMHTIRKTFSVPSNFWTVYSPVFFGEVVVIIACFTSNGGYLCFIWQAQPGESVFYQRGGCQ